jgi:transposase
MESLTQLFCLMDDFCREFEAELEKHLMENGVCKRHRQTGLCLSEMMTLVVLFHQLRYRQFKAFYIHHVRQWLCKEFPDAPSYQRCVALMPRCALALTALFETLKGQCTGLSILDSTPLAVCDNLRIKRHRVFKGIAQRGKTSTGWFFGFKLHTVINHNGELLAVKLTPGNVDDRKPVPDLCTQLFGKLYGDKGYLSKTLVTKLREKGIELITKVRRNMKAVTHSAFDLAVLKQRSLIETVFDQLKNLCQIEHSRHRSLANFIVNLLAGIVAYCLEPKKPSLPVSCVNTLNSQKQKTLIQN